MANRNHLRIFKKGLNIWDTWRQKNPTINPDLSGIDLTNMSLIGVDFTKTNLSEADLSKADLFKAELRGADLSYAECHETNFIGADLTLANLDGANLQEANLCQTDLRRAKLRYAEMFGARLSWTRATYANLREADLWKSDLSGADLTKASLSKANLTEAKLISANLIKTNLARANLTKADLREADLRGAELKKANLNEADLSKADLREANLCDANMITTRLIGAKLNGATLSECRVFGVAAWGLIGVEEADQSNLVITPPGEPAITVDNLEVAQFIYILLHSEKIRSIVDAITSKVVLILGRFTPERKVVLDALREQLRKRNYLPVLFDFDRPASRDITETVSTLAHMARFVIADITDAKSIPQELEAIVPNLPSVPIQPILISTQEEYGMFEHFKHYPWVLNTLVYDNTHELLKLLEEKVIVPAEHKARQLQRPLSTNSRSN